MRSPTGIAVTCATGADCTFGYALSLTPVLLSSTPAIGNQGDQLTVTGRTLSLTASENRVYVGDKSCEVLTAQLSTSSTRPDTVVELTCRLPHQDSLGPHTVRVATAAGGYAPALASATVTTPPQLRSISPTSGSIAGGTTLTLSGANLRSDPHSLALALLALQLFPPHPHHPR